MDSDFFDSIKRMLKLFTPPVVWALARRLIHPAPSSTVFEGVCSDIDSVDGTTYHDADSLTEALRTVEKERGLVSAGQARFTTHPEYRRWALPFLSAIIASNRSPVSIIDYGGDLGVSYVDCLRHASSASLSFHVVDLSAVVEQGADLFSDDRSIEFHCDLPELSSVDIVHLGSSLQYVKDYKGLLKTIAGMGPRFILVAGTPMTTARTYATAQVNVPGLRIPCWIPQTEELISVIEEGGYRLMFRSAEECNLACDSIPVRAQPSSIPCLLFARSSENG